MNLIEKNLLLWRTSNLDVTVFLIASLSCLWNHFKVIRKMEYKKKPKANSIFYKTRQSEAANHSEFIMATKGSGCQRQYGVLSVGLYRSQNYTVFP